MEGPARPKGSGPRSEGVADIVAPPPRHRRFPLLDAMRAIAALSVLVFHASAYGAPAERFVLHLNVGVTVFFLLSGFLLYRPFAAHRAGGPDAPASRDYLRRRALRIFPAYWLLLAAILIPPGLLTIRGGDLLGQFALLQTMPFAGPESCGQSLSSCSVAHTWSLAVELTFYLTLPLYVLMADRLARGRPASSWVRAELLILAVLATASTVARFVLLEPDQTSLLGGSVLGYGLWFGLGMALAILSVATEAATGRRRAIQAIRRHGGGIWLAAAGVYFLLALALPPTPFLTGADAVLSQVGFGLIALLLMLPAVFADDCDTVVSRVLSTPALAWLGIVSYGIFLWHLPVLYELSRHGVTGFVPVLSLALVVTVALAAVSYYAVERPALRLKNRRISARRDATILSGP